MRAAVKQLPRAAWVCALAAFLNALAWTLIVPLFQVPDEPAHVAYAQYIAESGKAPSGRSDRAPFSEEERRLVHVMRWKEVSRRNDNRPPVSASGHQLLERAANESLERRGEGGFTSITNNPPLYYGLAAVAYRVTPSSSLADRIHGMRLLSALLAAVTTLFVFLFLRELLPGTPWAWTVGALAVAFQPLFGFVSGGVNSDDLLFAAAACVFYFLAAAFRRGLTTERGVWIGALAAIGLLAKINMLGLLPGIVLGLILLIRRAPAEGRREATRGAAWAIGILAGAAVVYIALNEIFWDRGLFFGADNASLRGGPGIKGPGDVATAPSGGIADAVSYAWQFYLPRLPFMTDQFNNFPLYEVWVKGFVGIFGWLDYGFPRFVYPLALWTFLAILALAGREFISKREAVKGRLSELATYAVIMLGLLVLTNGNGYSARVGGAGGFEQARYLLPLLALYAAIVALAARGAGRRWGPAAGIVLVSIAVAHSAVAMLLTVTRYYG